MLVVKLDNVKYPGNGGTVVGHILYLSEIKRFADKDGCVPSDLRIWQGKAKVGEKVITVEPDKER